MASKVEKRANQAAAVGLVGGAAHTYPKERNEWLDAGWKRSLASKKGKRVALKAGIKYGAIGGVVGAGVGLAEKRRSTHRGIDSK